MKHDPSNTQHRPVENVGEPNENGSVIGTAGRDEDPGATTDWDHPDNAVIPGEDVVKPANGTPEIDLVPVPDKERAD